VVGNFDVNSQAASVTFPAAGTWYDYLNGTTFTATGAAQNINLLPGEYHVFLNRNLVNAVLTPVSNLNRNNDGLGINVYPNPVRSTSVIEVNIPQNGQTEIIAVNDKGQQLAKIFSGFLSKGDHRISAGSIFQKLPSGVYLLKLQSKNSSKTIKVTL
jgi:hypothetical protein